MLLSLAIISYILSFIVSLVFIFTGKRLHPGMFRMFAGIHIVFLAFFLFTIFTISKGTGASLAFLLFFCSGIVVGGLAFGMNKPLPFKIYFGLFIASIILFLLSPSTLLNFLVTGTFSSGEQLIPVQGKYNLEVQNTFDTNDSANIQYKLIRKTGMFHKTISRNISFNGRLDSIRVLNFENGIATEIRGYTGRKTFVSNEVDSVDVTINLNPTNKDVIERRL
jgi:hypothetical protein